MTSAAVALIAELALRGVQLAAAGERLRYRPREAVSPDLATDLARHKRGLLTLLNTMAAPGVQTGMWARCASALLAKVQDNSLRTALREMFEERVAICEYDGQLTTDEAERLAFAQLCHAVAAAQRGARPTPNPEGATP